MNQQRYDHIDTLSLFCINLIMALVLAINYFGIQALIVFGTIGAFSCISSLCWMLISGHVNGGQKA